mmetsp:Transcript_67897/g.196539  ORF Transcript_67897/g.196539 Transcript_67897/m.196539 type:complete len:618 (-) Transcript_67897:153-2006(-)
MVRHGAARRSSALRLCATAAASALAVTEAADVAPRRLGFGTFTAEASNPTFSESKTGGLSGMMNNMQGQGSLPMPSADQQEEVSEESSAFIAAMIQSFLHKQQLQPGELDCIVSGSKNIGGNVGRLANQVGMVLERVFDTNLPGIPGSPEDGSPSGMMLRDDLPTSQGHVSDGAGSIEDMVAQIKNGGSGRPPSPQSPPQNWPQTQPQKPQAPPPTPAPAPDDPSLAFFYNNGRRLQMMPSSSSNTAGQQAQSADAGGGVMGAVPVAMEVGYYMEQIVSESKDLVGKCVHSDAKAAFQTAGKHMRDLQYMTGHLLANGADIVKEFADSVMAYEEKDPARFGNDAGIALRKVFLSNNAGGSLPEGLPAERELANVTAGFLEGFFGPGTAMNVKFSQHPNSPIRIDMHTCVSENIRFFQQIWASTMYLFAQKAVGVDKAAAASDDKKEVQFGTMVAFTMMELPGAMDKCNIDSDHKDMILDSLKSFGNGMHAKLSLPSENVEKKAIVEGFAQTVKDWSKHNYYHFGYGLGNTMRKSTVAYFPKKYAVTPSGLLEQIAPKSAKGGAAFAFFMPAMLVFAGFAVALQHRRRVGVLLRRGPDASMHSRDLECFEDGSLLAVE